MQKNPFAQQEAVQMIELRLSPGAVDCAEEAFGEEALSLASFEVDQSELGWRTRIYTPVRMEREAVLSKLILLEELTGHRMVLSAVETVESRDWVLETQQAFPAFSVGDFYIHGSHDTALPPLGSTPLLIDANAAFGTGEHATTQGCLLAIQHVCRRSVPRNALDMGCGTGILALSLAARWHVPVLGVEIDAVAVRVAQENTRLNQARRDARIVLGNGYQTRILQKRSPYDLIVANILARPLMSMAPDLNRHLAVGGHAVLSGLLDKQARMVLAAHRQQGLKLVRQWRIDGWSTLLLQK